LDLSFREVGLEDIGRGGEDDVVRAIASERTMASETG